MEEKIRELENLEEQVKGLEGGQMEINLSPDSKLHKEIRMMKKEGKKLKGFFFI